jgi:hypothetical protein
VRLRRLVRLLNLVLAATSAAALVLAVPASARPSHAPAAATFGIATARDGKIDSRPSLSYTATPGSRLDDEVALVNFGSSPVRLRLFATDATTGGSNGAFGLLPTAAKPKDLGTWITLHAPQQVVLKPRSTRGPSVRIVPITVRFPVTATPGDHAGGIVLSLVGSARNDKGLHVKLDQRVGLRIYARVAGRVRAGLTVDHLQLRYIGAALLGNPFGDGAAVVTYEVRNTGNVLLGARQSVDVSGWLGADHHIAGSAAATTGKDQLPLIQPLLPGASLTVRRIVHGVFPGLHLTATVHLAPYAPAGAADPQLSPVARSSGAWAVPWTLLAILVILALAVTAAAWRWRRRRRARPERSSTSHRRSAVLARTGSGA